MGRKKDKKKNKKKIDNEAIVERATEIKDQARALADESGPAVKEFAHVTSGAAKDFASTAVSAAKELFEAVEKASDKLEADRKPKKKRGRRLLKWTFAVGAGVFVATNETTRAVIGQAVKRVTGGGEEPDWQVPSEGNGFEQPAPTPEKMTP